MAFRAQLGVLPLSFRWIAACSVAWTAMAAAAAWMTSRFSSRVGIARLSDDWLQDFERKSIRQRDL